jgi:hypothetical protein
MGRSSSAQAQIEMFKERKAQGIAKLVMDGFSQGTYAAPPRLAKPVAVPKLVEAPA